MRENTVADVIRWRKPEEPSAPSLLSKEFKYTAGGNVQTVWRKYGWVPPTEYRTDYLFKQNRENLEGDINA